MKIQGAIAAATVTTFVVLAGSATADNPTDNLIFTENNKVLGQACPIVRRGSPFGPVEDATLIPALQSLPGNGTGLVVANGAVAGPARDAKVLMRFRLNPALLPSTAAVLSAEVVLHPSEWTQGSLNVREVTKAWDDKTVTAQSFGTNGVKPGVYKTVPLHREEEVIRFDVTDLAQDWLSGRKPNHGVLLEAAPTTNAFMLGMHSSNAAVDRPELVVCIRPSPCTGNADGTACSNASECTVNGKCQAGVCKGSPAPAGTVCRPATGACDGPESCNGQDTRCSAQQVKAAGTSCRAGSGECDVPEACNGVSAHCPVDVFKPSTLVCRAARGVCDAPESCTGKSGACPPDGFHSTGVVCRAPVGACDAREFCTGQSIDCPPDKLEPAHAICRPATNTCVHTALCTGTSPSCPASVAAPDGSACPGGDHGVCEGGSCLGCGVSGQSCCPPSTGFHPCGAGLSCAGGKCAGQQQPPPGQCGVSGAVCCNNQTCSASSLVCLNPGSALSRCQPCGGLHLPCCNQYSNPPYGCSGNLGCVHTSGLYTCESPPP